MHPKENSMNPIKSYVKRKKKETVRNHKKELNSFLLNAISESISGHEKNGA